MREAGAEKTRDGVGLGRTSQKARAASEAGESVEADRPLHDPGGARPGWCPDVGPTKPFPHSGLRKQKSECVLFSCHEAGDSWLKQRREANGASRFASPRPRVLVCKTGWFRGRHRLSGASELTSLWPLVQT